MDPKSEKEKTGLSQSLQTRSAWCRRIEEKSATKMFLLVDHRRNG